jgi:hypothetical protein
MIKIEKFIELLNLGQGAVAILREEADPIGFILEAATSFPSASKSILPVLRCFAHNHTITHLEQFRRLLQSNCFLAHFLVEFKVELSAGSVSTLNCLAVAESQELLQNIWEAKAHHLYVNLVSRFDLHSIIPLNAVYIELSQLSHVSFLDSLIKESLRSEFLDNFIDSRLNLPKTPSGNWSDYPQLGRTFGKVSRKLCELWGIGLQSYPKIVTLSEIGNVTWLVNELVRVYGMSGNTRYSKEEIAQSYMERIGYYLNYCSSLCNQNSLVLLPLLVHAVSILSKIHETHIFACKLANMFPDVKCTVRKSQRSLKLQPVDSGPWYTCDAEIRFVSDNTHLDLFRESCLKSTVASIDCEWNSTLDLIQIGLNCTPFVIFLLDVQSLADELTKFIELIWEMKVLGFDCKQDLQKIAVASNLKMPENVLDMRKYCDKNANGLGNLAQKYLQLHVDKRPRLGNWATRPLCQTLQLYAAGFLANLGDVSILLDVYQKIQSNA